jgi:hypothetical protein
MKKYLRRSAASVTKVLNYYMPPSPEKRAKKAKCEKTMCCGSEAFLTPGFGMRKKIKIRIWNEHPGSYFREIRNYFFFIKNGSGAWIREGKIRIRDKHTGSATLNTIMIHLHPIYTVQHTKHLKN